MMHSAGRLGGACLKSQVAHGLGYKPVEPTDEQATLMAQGQLHEDDVIAILRSEGFTITRQQEGVGLLRQNNTWTPLNHLPQRRSSEFPTDFVGAWGLIDGIIKIGPGYSGTDRVLEIKSMGETVFKSFKAKGWEAGGIIDKYRFQISVYMHALQSEAFVVAKRRSTGELLRSGVELPFYTLDQIAERVGYIEDHVARGQLPDDCPHDWFCDFKYLCSRSSEEDSAEHSSDELTAEEVSAVSEYHRLGREIKALEDLRADTRLSVEALAGRSGGGYQVRMVTQQIKERVVPASTRQMLRVTKTGDEDVAR